MNSSQFRQAAHDAVDEIIDYFETIQDRPVLPDIEPGYLQPLIPDHAPQEGERWEDIQRDVASKIMPGMTHWQSPNFMAYFPATTSYPSILGELYSAAFSAPGFNWQCSPVMTELETVVLDWMAKMLHLPTCFLSNGRGGGVIQGSASEAIVTVMIAARERYLNAACQGLEGEQRQATYSHVRNRLVALGSEQSHSATAKAATIAGVRYKSIHTDFEDNLAMTASKFENALAQCEAEGLEPFYLTVTLGTTSSCAIDDLMGIAKLKNSRPNLSSLWIHVDAAYAGSALILEEFAPVSKDLDQADSFDMNLHKWLLVNFDLSALYVRDRRNLTDVLSVTPAYLRNKFSESGLVTDYRDWQIPLGRRFRALKMWFVLRSYGVKALQDHIQRGINLGITFADWIKSRPDLFRLLAPPAFALTVFTVVLPDAKSNTIRLNDQDTGQKTDKAINEGLTEAQGPLEGKEEQSRESVKKSNDPATDGKSLTEMVYTRLNASGKIFLTSTVVNGIYAMRVISANERANEQSLREAFDLIVSIAQQEQETERGEENMP